MRITSSFGAKIKAAYEHGRMDFWAGAPYDTQTPLRVYRDLNKFQQVVISQAWSDGWNNECLMQALPDGMPA